MLKSTQSYTSAAPLAVFRMTFGILLFASMMRFWSKGWIRELYIKPKYFFPYYGFEFVRPFGEYTYLLFAVCTLSCILVAVGLFYRAAIISLFISFTYIELIDKSTYLNHYYFISAVSFLLIFLPAHVYFSADAYRNRKWSADEIPGWCILSLKLFIGLLYIYAGLAKINSDWLLHALPLKIWLPARNDMPLIGFLFNDPRTAFVFSWAGCLYDLSIPFLIWKKSTRPFAFVAVVCFHVFTAILFPIGMFPYVMIVAALIFFSDGFHQKVIGFLAGFMKLPASLIFPSRKYRYSPAADFSLGFVFLAFFTFQLLVPLRYTLYPGELFWTEEGYRFSWRVMLMEKAGYTQFLVKDQSGHSRVVNNNEFLTALQEKMMSTQPDMILQYAHILRDHYAAQGFKSPEVYVESYVALNGRLGKSMISPEINLAEVKESFAHKSWITPLNDEIKGF